MYKQKKVVIAIPVLLIGGTEIQTLNLVRVLVDAGYEVTVCCYYEYDQTMVVKMHEAGAEVLLMELRRTDGLWNLFRVLIKVFNEIAPDIIHVQYVAPGLVPIIAARVAGMDKVIATVHQPGRTHGWKARILLRFGARLCKTFFCVSKSVEESWFGDSALFDPELYRKGRKHFTIYNAVDTERISREANSAHVAQLRTSLDLEGKKVIGFVGRLRWEKGPHILVAAFARVAKLLPDTRLLVVGDGPGREELFNQAKELGIAENILWLGQRSQDEVFQLYGLMDIVAMPSIFEGFGLTAVEAMSAGVPVVAADVDGLMEIVSAGETGLFFPSGNSDALAACIIDLLNQKELLVIMKVKARVRAGNFFSLSILKRNTFAMYETILAGNR